MKRTSTMRVGRGVSIIEATEDPVLFARWFRKRETWAAWFAFLKVLFGLPLGEAELETFRACTGRHDAADRDHARGASDLRPEGGQELHPGADRRLSGVLPSNGAGASAPASAARSWSSPPTGSRRG